MQNLKYFYENPPEVQKFIPRKKGVNSPKTILFGCVGSGKSYILAEYILNFKKDEFLYINFADLRYKFTRLNTEFDKIFEFLEKNSQIGALFLDNLDEFSENEILHLQNLLNLVFSNSLPNSSPNSPQSIVNLRSVVISTRKNSLNLQGFTKVKITPLCFEEFIAFDKRRTDINAIISAFFLQGGTPKNSFLNGSEIMSSEQNALKSALNKNEIAVLKECCEFIAQPFSANKIYLSLKEQIRISKDSIYGCVAKFEDENFVNFVSKFGDEKAAKRLFLSNFNLKDALSFKKDFSKKFINAIFCEIANLNEPIFYTKDLDFYLPSRNLGVLAIPFSASEIVFLKFKKLIGELKRLKITRLSVISMANSGTLEIEGIKCEVVPFPQFALGL
ncbi:MULTISPECIES: AAA family ATPase [unclassified Campylobacter]|uniref:AAA family ATPase n=1 Tax=unclassified Campylobacter TaxID=2593542 RepID=UPI0022E9C10D|nr:MULTISPECIES: AAA family ATPase [unclassified Campylobacter]MDA3080168.1 ATP-binding protein [Campylobacter sp. CS_NA2]MDA3081611.1 ATP-binding protein [Campylobacter sp. CS_NA1]MDA3086225.1 ATP-binding protein [Campylobacter sp. CS_ED1]MDA3090826.1 ATP-binding protein [Campylobacter sp. CS_ED2]WBR51099.1 ATP-binding protein [Campylobacter sp. CS_NA3]